TPPADAFVARVGRGKGAYRSLADACAAAPAGKALVLEVHDNGPLFTLPWSVEGRGVFLRAAKGWRPLLVGDLPAALRQRLVGRQTKEPLVWATLKKASLVLEGIDLAWRWPEGEGGAATLLDVTDGEVDARDCTFSVAGKPRDPATLLRLRDGRAGPGRCRWQRCHVRGAEVTALD